MPKKTAGSTGATIPLPPKILSGKDVYNRIMGSIEPELMTESLPTLMAKYANENQTDRDARMERYKKAFVAYEKAYKEFLLTQESGLRTYKGAVMSAVEKRSGGNDNDALENISSMISNPTL